MSDSSVDLAELERAFAKDPASDAFLALSRAYLAQSRFMEAMVVCKKGIKNRPESVEGRLLLGQVYAEQGKLPKALDEVQKLLAEHDDRADAHFFLGQLHERSGRFEEAIEAFQAAFARDPRHEEAVAALKAKGIEVEVGPSPEELEAARLAEEARVAEAEALAAEQAAAELARQAAEATAAQAIRPAAIASGGHPAAPAGAVGAQTFTQMPATDPTGAPHPSSGGVASPFLGGYDPLAASQARSRKLGFGFTFGLGALLLLALVSFVVLLKNNKEAKEAIGVHVLEAKKAAAPGTTGGLKKSLEAYDEILKLDEEHPLATARLAHTLALLTTERGLAKEYKERATKRVAAAKKHAPEYAETVAAEVLMLLSDGKPDEAVAAAKDIKKPVVAIAKAQALLATGKLDLVKLELEPLTAAQDPNVNAMTGALWRKMGDRSRGSIALNEALKRSAFHDVARAERALYVLEVKDLDYLGIALDDVSTLMDAGKDNLGQTQRGYAMLGRAEIGRINGRDKEAQRDLTEARRTIPRDGQTSFFTALFALASGDQKGAVTALQEATTRDKYRLLPWVRLIEEAGNARNATVSKKAYEDAKAIFGSNLQIELARVDALISARSVNEAHSLLKTLVKAYDVAEVHRELGRILLIKRKTDKAVAELKTAAEKSEKSSRLVKATVYTLLGRALARTDAEDDAVGAYKEALGASRNYAPAYYYLGVAFEGQKKTGAAREAYEHCIKLDANSTVGKKSKRRLEGL